MWHNSLCLAIHALQRRDSMISSDTKRLLVNAHSDDPLGASAGSDRTD